MVSAMDSRLDSLGLSPDLAHCIVFLDKRRHSPLTMSVKNAYKACVVFVVVQMGTDL